MPSEHSNRGAKRAREAREALGFTRDGTLAAFIAGLDREARTDLRDQIGVAGGTVGLTVWLLTSILMD
ncbi:MAG: hypothetical protein ACR2FZ_01780 [Thermoleophilaceae bacterium]